MPKPRADLQTQLDELALQTPLMVREHPDEGDFWAAFAGASDPIVDDAGAEDYDWVLRQIDDILKANGRMPVELAPSDDLPPAGPTLINPTAEGLRRYPHTAGFYPDLPFPCTCVTTCRHRCAGACGCEACSMAFSVFADEAGFFGFEPMSPEREAEAIARYEDV